MVPRSPIHPALMLRSFPLLALAWLFVIAGCGDTESASAVLKSGGDKGSGPAIVSITYGTITQHTAELRITLGDDASVIVDYDLNEWPKVVEERTYASEHILVLDRLRAGASHDFTVEASLPDGSNTVSDTISLDTIDYPGTTAFLPPGWESVDIGLVSPELPGSAWAIDSDDDGDAFMIDGTGTDIYFNRDSFHFAHYPVDGDFRLTFRVDGYSGYLHFWTKAFAQFRTGLGEGASMFTQSLNYEGLDYLYFRDVDAEWHTDITSSQLHEAAGSPLWARLTRTGDFFVQEYSHDGDTWLVHGPAEGTEVALSTDGFIGIGVCGKSNSYLSQITYSNVVIEHCGDGIVTWGDVCDDANRVSGDGCDATCSVEPDYTCVNDPGGPSVCTTPGCGDGRLDPGEECDAGASNSDTAPDTCRVDCTLPRCGDGVSDEGEACDAGASNSDTVSDACRLDCSLPICGDGVADTGEACDAGASNSDTAADACRLDCGFASCGDGVADTGEACDDGADRSDTLADACRLSCRLPFCGDAVVDSAEECDDGDDDSEDGCDECVAIDLDLDGDGVPNVVDNCPGLANADQSDLDDDGGGDVCDEDDDQDGLPDAVEDADGDGLRGDLETDPRNPDTDADGLCDGWTAAPLLIADVACDGGEDLSLDGVWDVEETDPLVADTDGDCASDGEESLADPATDPLDADDTPELADVDGDGVPDRCDDCPGSAGEPDDGCPVIDPPDAGPDAAPDVGSDVPDADVPDVGADVADTTADAESDVVPPDADPDTGDLGDEDSSRSPDSSLPDASTDARPDTGETGPGPDGSTDTADGSDIGSTDPARNNGGCGTSPGQESPLSLIAALALALCGRRRRSLE